jgi:hypothetical protein
MATGERVRPDTKEGYELQEVIGKKNIPTPLFSKE